MAFFRLFFKPQIMTQWLQEPVSSLKLFRYLSRPHPVTRHPVCVSRMVAMSPSPSTWMSWTKTAKTQAINVVVSANISVKVFVIYSLKQFSPWRDYWQLFAEGEVNIGEYLTSRRRGKYSPIFILLEANNCFSIILKCGHQKSKHKPAKTWQTTHEKSNSA